MLMILITICNYISIIVNVSLNYKGSNCVVFK